jgi:hypothetical protein
MPAMMGSVTAAQMKKQRRVEIYFQFTSVAKNHSWNRFYETPFRKERFRSN